MSVKDPSKLEVEESDHLESSDSLSEQEALESQEKQEALEAKEEQETQGEQEEKESEDAQKGQESQDEKPTDQNTVTMMRTGSARKRPTGKIALLASICVVILGISIWSLVAVQVPGNTEQAMSELSNSNTDATQERITNADARENSVAATQDEKPQTEDSSSVAADSTSTTTVTESVAGGSTSESASQDGNTASSQGGSTAPQPINVTLSVNCQVAIEAGSATAYAVSDNGAMRYASLRLNAGTNVYEALVASQAALGTRGGALGMYIVSIDGLPEGEAGPQSGWKYYVNGTAPGMSSDLYVLSDGDVIEWRYVTSA